MEKRDNEELIEKIFGCDLRTAANILEIIRKGPNNIIQFYTHDCHPFPPFLEENVEEYFKKYSKSIFGESTKVEVGLKEEDPEDMYECQRYFNGTKIVYGDAQCKYKKTDDEQVVLLFIFYGLKTPTGKSHLDIVGLIAGEPHTNYEGVKEIMKKIKKLTDFGFIDPVYPPFYDPIKETAYNTFKKENIDLVFFIEGFEISKEVDLRDILEVGENFYKELFKDDNFVAGGYENYFPPEGKVSMTVLEEKDNKNYGREVYLNLRSVEGINIVRLQTRGVNEERSDGEIRDIIQKINEKISNRRIKIVEAERYCINDQIRETGLRRIL
ncbi:MAG: hypothetical protein N3D78_01335 [Candidatus Aenigmarchaeota archaeon]|nr:hypothetical protein [Candidatus Aenigmarchaeota archaeon]